MINKDDELEGYVRIGANCDFLEKYNEFVEISAQKIRELLLDPKINNIRIKGAVITDTLDLRDTLSAEGSPLGGLELISCVILEPLRLERSHLTHLSLLKSAFTELHAQNCRIEGPVDLGYVYSREEPESRSFKDNLEYSSDNRAIDEAFKNIPLPDNGKTGLSGPDYWWKYETALETTSDLPQNPRGRCQVDLSEASIGGSLNLDGCRLVAAAINDKKELIKDPSNPAIDLSNAKIDGDCIVRGGHVPRDGSVISATSGSFLGKFSGKNICLQGDFWGCSGIYWGYFNRAIFFQGARIKGGVFFQKRETDQSNDSELPQAVFRGEVNFLAARIEGWSDLSGLHCLHSAFCLSKKEDDSNNTNTLLNFATATIGSDFQLQIEDKNEIKLRQDVNLQSLKIGGNLWIKIDNYNKGIEKNNSLLWMNSSEVRGNFTFEGDIDSYVSAVNMCINGSCTIVNAQFRNYLTFSGLKIGGDFEFHSIIHKSLKSTADSAQVMLDGTEVKGDFKFYGDIDAAVSAKNMRVNGSCLIAAHFRNKLEFPSLKVGGDFEFSSTIDKLLETQDKNNSTDPQTNQNKGNANGIQVMLDGTEVSGYFKFTANIDATISARNMHISGFCSIEDDACFKEDVEFRGLNAEGDVRFYPTIHKKADLSGIHVRGSLYLSRDLEKGIDNFKSIKLVHKITIQEWRRFADLQSSRENFLNACLNNPTCQLILKHAVIEKELRIHRLQTELGDTDTNLINWTGRIREFFRKPLRLLISYSDNLPAKFRNRFVKWAMNKLHRLYGNSYQVTVAYLSDELSFYPGYYWMRCYVEQKTINHVTAGGLIDCLWNPAAQEIVIVGGKSAPIHQLNQQGTLKLETEEQAKNYLRFFCECVWGEDQGPFHIYEIPHEFDADEIKQLIKEIVITEEKPEYWVAKAHVIYADYVFNSIFHIYKNGSIQMTDDKPIQDGVNIQFQFSKSYRFDNSGKSETLKAVRPLKLNLHNANRKEVRNNISSLLPNAEKSFSEKINLLQTPPLFNGVQSIFYKYSGKFRRWLDRYELFLPMQLPVIDLRGAHVETLNDRRGNGWRNPESFKFNHNWLNYGIFLRLEGFTFNRLIHIVEPIESNAAANFESNDTDNENIVDNFQSSSEISATNKNQSLQKKQPSPAPPPSALNDQNWKARLGWLYQQYPQGVPDGNTFDQQPFSQVIKAYRSRGDIANVNGILRAKISIEFMLFAQRVTPMFLLVFGLFAGITFMIATHTMASAVNENLWPVVLGVIVGALGTLIFCLQQEKLDRNYFIFIILPTVLIITYFVSGLLFSNHSAPASVFFTQLLFLSIVMWGIGIGRLIVYIFQIIYWICFDYGLSIFRALLTILICLAIGAWGVNTVNNDKKFLVLNVEYATPFVDGENQPHFMRIKPTPETTASLHSSKLEQTQSAATMECGEAIDPFIYALDVFISLVDLRQEILCNLRSADPTKLEEKSAEWSLLLKETTWQKRGTYLWDEVLNMGHPQMWMWLAAAYTILGWVVISLTILTIARNIKNYLSDNNQ